MLRYWEVKSGETSFPVSRQLRDAFGAQESFACLGYIAEDELSLHRHPSLLFFYPVGNEG